MLVFCNDCKFLRTIKSMHTLAGRSGGYVCNAHKGTVLSKPHWKEAEQTIVYPNPKEKNANNDCADFVPVSALDLWRRLWHVPG